MDLEHHTHFLREVRAGDQVSVYLRILGVSGKRWHYMMFLVNETSAQLAATFECVNTFVDLGIRKSAPWPPEIASALKTLLARHDSLDWVAPSCGSMHA